MALKLYDKITPSGNFALVASADIEMSDGTRLEEFLEALVGSIQVEVDYETALAFDTEEIVVEFTDASAVLGVAVLGKMILGHS